MTGGSHAVAGDSGNGAPDRAGWFVQGVAPALLFVLALAVRALTWPAVFTAGGVRLAGPDAHYHMRRIAWSVANFPAVLDRDAYLNFPDGGEAIWTPVFDWILAAATRIAVGPDDWEAMERLLVWAPVILGAATVVALYVTARRHFGGRVALGAAGILCILPPHVWYSQIGFVDHHAAIALVTTWLCCAALSAVGGAHARGISLGCAIGASLILWPGCIIHVAIVQCALLAHALTAERGEAIQAARRAAVAHATAWIVVAPLALGRHWEAWSDLSPVVLSDFQPLWLGLPAIGFGIAAALWRSGRAATTRRDRAATLVAALALPACLALLSPALREGITDAGSWLFRTEAFQAVVAESLPLLSDGTGFAPRRAHGSLSLLIYLFPIIWLALVVARDRTREHRLVAGWGAVLFAATLSQYRFANSFSVVWALMIALAAARLAAFLRAHVPAGSRAVALRAGGAVAALVLIMPIASSHGRALGTARRALAGEAVVVPTAVTHHGALVEAAQWLAENTPPTAGWLDTAVPEYGVLSAWGDGHVLRYVARRPVVQDNFGDDVGASNFARAEAYFAAPTEAQATRILVQLRVRYVVVQATGSGHKNEPYGARSMLTRLHRLRGSEGSFQGAPEAGDAPDGGAAGVVFVPALRRHRLVYESELPASDESGGFYKIYELVAGARVTGRTAPGELVEARIPLAADSGRVTDYTAHARADATGRYQLRLPYPTEPFGAVSPTGLYELRSVGSTATLALAERAVKLGTVVKGPSFVE